MRGIVGPCLSAVLPSSACIDTVNEMIGHFVRYKVKDSMTICMINRNVNTLKKVAL